MHTPRPCTAGCPVVKTSNTGHFGGGDQDFISSPSLSSKALMSESQFSRCSCRVRASSHLGMVWSLCGKGPFWFSEGLSRHLQNSVFSVFVGWRDVVSFASLFWYDRTPHICLSLEGMATREPASSGEQSYHLSGHSASCWACGPSLIQARRGERREFSIPPYYI